MSAMKPRAHRARVRQLELELGVDGQCLGRKCRKGSGSPDLDRIQQDDLGLVGQEAERAERLLILVGEPERRDRFARFESAWTRLTSRAPWLSARGRAVAS